MLPTDQALAAIRAAREWTRLALQVQALSQAQREHLERAERYLDDAIHRATLAAASAKTAGQTLGERPGGFPEGFDPTDGSTC